MSKQLTFGFYEQNKYNPVDLAYIAGLVDGEGHIGLTMNNSKARSGSTWTPRLQVGMCEKDGIVFMRNVLGGKLRTYKQKSQEHIVYRLEYSNRNNMMKVLRLLIPYLKVKKGQAELVLAFLEIREKKIMLSRNSRYAYYGHEEIDIYNQLKGLNSRKYENS